MKAFVVAVFAALVIVTPCDAQVTAVAPGTAEYDDMIERSKQLLSDQKKAEDAGRAMFGVDPESGRGLFSGTLWSKETDEYAVGDWGVNRDTLRILNRVSDQECLVTAGRQVMLLRGLDMSKVVDGTYFRLFYPVWINGTYSYTTVTGAQKTVLVLEYDMKKRAQILENMKREAAAKAAEEAKTRQIEEARQKLIEKAKWRTWTAASGGHQIVAKFVSSAVGMVTLQKEDGTTLEVKLDQLSTDDQSFIKGRKWLDIDATELAKQSEIRTPQTASQSGPYQRKPTKEGGTPPPPPRPATVPDSRTQWLNTTYKTTIYHIEGKRWAEKDNATGKDKWQLDEIARTPNYIELYNPDRKQTWRLHGKKMDLKKGDSWGWLANGYWSPKPGPSRGNDAEPDKPTQTTTDEQRAIHIIANGDGRDYINASKTVQASVAREIARLIGGKASDFQEFLTGFYAKGMEDNNSLVLSKRVSETAAVCRIALSEERNTEDLKRLQSMLENAQSR